MSNCKQCNKEVIQIEGKRERKFCSDTCRQKNYQERNKKKPPLEEGKFYSWVGGQLIEVELPDIPLVEFKTESTYQDNQKSDFEPPSIDNSEIESQIKAIESEKIPSWRNSFNGRKAWKLEQEKRISDLKKQLTTNN